MLQLGSPNVEGGGGGEASDDRLREEPSDHTTSADSQEKPDDAAHETKSAHREEIAALVRLRIDERERAAHHHRHKGEGTDVHVLRCPENTVQKNRGDAPVQTVDRRQVRQHRIRHSLGVRKGKRRDLGNCHNTHSQTSD